MILYVLTREESVYESHSTLEGIYSTLALAQEAAARGNAAQYSPIKMSSEWEEREKYDVDNDPDWYHSWQNGDFFEHWMITTHQLDEMPAKEITP